ncbi:MAG: hypothetical protein ABJQ34_09910 [Paracoccaceae bacterium]
MKQSAILILCMSFATPIMAQDDEAPSLLERGAQMFLEGLLEEMEPALDDMQDFVLKAGPAFKEFVDAMGPALIEVFDQVEDWSTYEVPEILENGDIIIRKKPPADPKEQGADPEEQIDI